MKNSKQADALEVLKEFVGDIQATGGVVLTRKGNYVPYADEDWIDLGATAVKAQAALAKAGIKVELTITDESE